jgi:O-antigen/teichoic acid export membrane protein
VEFGTSANIVRSVARNRETASSAFFASVGLKSLQVLAVLLCCVFLVLVLGVKIKPVILLLLFLPPLEIVYLSSSAILTSFEEFSHVARFGLFYDVTRALLVAVAAIVFKNLELVAVGYLLAACLASVLICATLFKKGEMHLQGVDIRSVTKFYRNTFWLFLYGIAFQVYFKIDVLMLNAFKDASEVGLYTAAYKFFEVFLFVPALIMGVLFPSFSRITDRDVYARWVKEIQRYLSVFGMAIVLLFFVLSDQIIGLSYGSAFGGSASILRVLALTLALYFVNCVWPMSLNSRGFEKSTLLCLGIGIAANVSLNLWLIPLLGAMGAALATLFAELIVSICYFYFVNLRIGKAPFFSAVWKPVLACATVILAGKICPPGNAYLVGALSIGIYAIMIVALKAIRRTDWLLVRSALMTW